MRRYEIEVDGGICTGCGEECDGKAVSDGSEYDYIVVSDCCREPIAEDGGVVVNATSFHKARKDLIEDGKVVVRAGRRYRKRYTRTWFIDTDGTRKGIVSIWKRELL